MTPSLNVPVIEELAAFTADTSPSEALQSDECFTGRRFANHAIYTINTHNFGFAGKRHCRAIVDLNDDTIIDNRLVIALHGDNVYARRLRMQNTRPEILGLCSEAEDPLKRSPTLILPTEEVRLLMVVGILFDDRPHHTESNEEASIVSKADIFDKVELVFKVRGISALPLALDGQAILGGCCLTPTQVNQMEGQLVAVSTSEGSAFKRIGQAIPKAPHVRMFESVGGLGESMLIRTEDINDAYDGVPLMTSARQVLGVLYNTL